MQYRILPADVTKISEIGLGLCIVTPQDDVRALLNGALERQINYFDLCGAYDCVYPAVKDTLACFMTASVLLNPQLIAYSAALGPLPFALRLGSCFLMALVAGLLVRYCYKNREFFAFSGFYEQHNRDTHPNVLLRYIKNVGRNLKVTAPYFIAGIVIAALFTIHQPQDDFADLFGKDNGLGVLFAATLGVPLYMCGGGTIPILIAWLASGMSLGSATAFMLSGPATKITNLAALKAVLGVKHFVYYLIYVIVFALFTGLAVNTLFSLMH